MNRNFLTLALCFVLGLILAANVDANDGLKNVFGNPTNGSATNAPFFSADQLEAFVDSVNSGSGYESSDDKTAYAFQYSQNEMNFPAWIHINENGRSIWAHYNLAIIPAEANPANYTDKLLELLAMNGNYGDFFFSFNPKTRMIAVYGCIQLRSAITNDDLTNHLNSMAKFSIDTQSIWDPSTWNSSMPKHVGTWHASVSNMTLVLSGSNSFELNADGQLMSGSFSIDGDVLVMQDTQGSRIEGNIRFDNGNQFTLMINGAPFNFVRK